MRRRLTTMALALLVLAPTAAAFEAVGTKRLDAETTSDSAAQARACRIAKLRALLACPLLSKEAPLITVEGCRNSYRELDYDPFVGRDESGNPSMCGCDCRADPKQFDSQFTNWRCTVRAECLAQEPAPPPRAVPQPSGSTGSTAAADDDPACVRECDFYAGVILDSCNAGRAADDLAPERDVWTASMDFRRQCESACRTAPGWRPGFTVSLHLDKPPNVCGVAWTWCTPANAVSVCAPKPPGLGQ